MNKQEIRKLIQEDDLEAAIELAIKEAEGSDTELINLAARLSNNSKQQEQGTISNEEYNLERNRVRVAFLALLNETGLPPGLQASNRMRIILLSAGVIVVALAGLISLFTQKDTVPKKTTLAVIEKSLGTGRLEFSRSKVPFKTSQGYKAGAAYLKREYSWDADVFFFVNPKDIMISFNPEKKALVANVKKVQLLDKFIITNQKSRTLENSLWMEETAKDGAFWADIQQTTRTLSENKFAKKGGAKAAIINTAKDGVHQKISKIIQQQNLKNIDLSVQINSLELISGQTVK